MKFYVKTTNAQNIRILAKILLRIIEGGEMNKEEAKKILTEIYKNGYYTIEKKGDEEDE